MSVSFVESRTHKMDRMLLIALLCYYRGREIDAVTASIWAGGAFGVWANWHEFSAALNQMKLTGDAKVVGFNNDGMTRYLINPQ